MSAVTTEASNDLRNRIVAVLREDRDVRNIGSLAEQLEAAIRSAEPVAWLRHGEETPVQNVPFGAMWISDKDDPRSFPVYDCPQQPAPSVAVNAEAQKREREKAGWVFAEGDRVRKKSGSWWEGRVVGTYSTEQTPRGYAVQLDKPFGPVQIYPESALESALQSEER